LIFFGGASPGQRPGADLTPGTSADSAYRHILTWSLFEQTIAKNPAVSNSTYNDAINPVIQALRNWPDSDRVGSVVIYGFSAGGFNALRLCQRISQEIRDIYGLPTGDPGLPRRINLLITIDPCIQDAPGLPPPPHWFEGLDRKAPSVVERHINYYQPQDPDLQGDDGHYHGCPMQGAENHSIGGIHDAMPENTLAFLMHPIRQSVSSNVDAWR
jgi:pimeloyl-ACP methyl ester carboxylesterase